jgi:hypothetical protein
MFLLTGDHSEVQNDCYGVDYCGNNYWLTEADITKHERVLVELPRSDLHAKMNHLQLAPIDLTSP